MSAGGIAAMNKVSSTATAFIEDKVTGGSTTVDGAKGVAVKSTDTAWITSNSKVITQTVTTNNVDALRQVAHVAGLDSYEYSNKSGLQLIAANARVIIYDKTGNVAGDDHGRVFSFRPDENDPDYTMEDGKYWVNLSTIGIAFNNDFVELQNSDFDDIFFPEIGNLQDSDAQAFGALLVYNDVRGGANAYVDNATVGSTTGDVAVDADEAGDDNRLRQDQRVGLGRLGLRHR